MVGSHPPVTSSALPTDRADRPDRTTVPLVPLPRRPLDPDARPGDRVRRWYENELGWATVPATRENPGGNTGFPVRLRVGDRFDVLDVPAEAGRAGLRHLVAGSPVALQGGRMRLLVAAGSAEELPGLLEWLEWRVPALDLTALGEGALMDAPLPPGRRDAAQGAAVWLRPPEPGCEVEASLPTMSAVGGVGGAPDLVRLVDTVATQCHRLRLRRGCAQPPAFPPASDQALAFS
ncbi:SCO3374 family protein [Streptomyces cylindrosporus]|uniref:SCO3374 family protein n=1 Tax=Streptomyces cylindrosporus TaxID=2927583 RepID=A0ABS9YP61_9ACTN|nr:SCO3374 family protein [Streptomyces cylindrosporus]MCI3279052.1 SCO3374 family protein [Streptomyces cylindrosporus]